MGILNLKKKTAVKFIKNKQNIRPKEKKTETKKIRKVGVLAELSLFETYDFRKRLSGELGIEEEDMMVFLFDPSGKENSSNNSKVCNEKSFGLYGSVKAPALANFLEKKFDLLINYCEADQVYDQVIMVRSLAGLKVGYDHPNNFFNDISIKIKGNQLDTFNAELVKYLEILKLID
jgi:hypothetical protein